LLRFPESTNQSNNQNHCNLDLDYQIPNLFHLFIYVFVIVLYVYVYFCCVGFWVCIFCFFVISDVFLCWQNHCNLDFDYQIPNLFACSFIFTSLVQLYLFLLLRTFYIRILLVYFLNYLCFIFLFIIIFFIMFYFRLLTYMCVFMSHNNSASSKI
jgi:hypothetical protein